MIQLNPVTGNAAHEEDWKTGVFMIESSGRAKDLSHLPKQLAHEIAVVGREAPGRRRLLAVTRGADEATGLPIS